MAKIEGRPTVTLDVTIRLTEAEAGALDALAGYGTDAFLRVFYEKMGRSYLEPYEAGLRSLFESVRNGPANVSGFITRARSARDVFDGRSKAVRNEPG
jgi:hypothetical protein